MKAIKATRQVTKAMELVAASKMRRAVSNAQKLRTYALQAWRILQKLSTVRPEAHLYMQEKELRNVLAVMFTPDRGLCGSLNAQLLRTVGQYYKGLKTVPTFQKLDCIAIGKKGQQFLPHLELQKNIVAAFPAFAGYPTFKDVLPISRMATEGFLQGSYDHVVLIYSDFISPLVQEPTVKVLLPFTATSLREMLGSILPKRYQRELTKELDEVKVGEYVLEPSEAEILETILPQLTEIQVYQAALEAGASEQSARMVAMRNASDSASDIIDDLSLVYNQTRQANITGELAELSAASAALKR